MKINPIAAAVIFAAAVVFTAIVSYRLGANVRRKETFDASKVRDPKVREEMEYLKKMYFS
jgi:hypothetical protein